jgi:hypothetical protein
MEKPSFLVHHDLVQGYRKQEDVLVKVKKLEAVEASGWIWGGGGG